MATGWAHEGAVQDQIDATIKDAIARARNRQSSGPSQHQCVECGADIPEGRQKAIPGVRLCVSCQETQDRSGSTPSDYNRRGSKDSQLR